MAIEKFETFLSLMEKNWPEAYQGLAPAIPCIDKIQSINEIRRSRLMADYSLQHSDFDLLTALRRSPEPYLLTPTQLLDHMLISSGGLSKALCRLEAKGMISRRPSKEDGRVSSVQLTAKGKTIIEEIVVKVQKNHKILKTTFSAQEQAQLNTLLAKLLDEMIKNPD